MASTTEDTLTIEEATGDYMSPNLSKTARIDFTDFFLRFRPAQDAHPIYKHIFTTHQEMAKLLIGHSAMQLNLRQTFSTPANSKNQVYFMWDFILRTFQHLMAKVDPRHPYRSKMFADVLSRIDYAQALILDPTENTLKSMNSLAGYSDDDGVDFTEGIKTLAKSLNQYPRDICAGCAKDKREDGRDLLQCSKCKEDKYCSAQCQKECWKVHREQCRPAAVS